MTIKPLYPEFGDASDDDDVAKVVEHESLDLEHELLVCLVCGTELDGSDLFQRLRVCPQCGFHYNISARSRIAVLVDPGTFEESHRWISSLDPLVFSPRVSYQVRVLNDQVRTGLSEAAVTGIARIGGARCAIIAIDFGFLGGSMGLVVGEKVARMFELAARHRLPVITFATSGGARFARGSAVADSDGEDGGGGANASRAWDSVDFCVGESVVGTDTFQFRFDVGYPYWRAGGAHSVCIVGSVARDRRVAGRWRSCERRIDAGTRSFGHGG